MSGVIDEHGQWEHCNECHGWVLIQHLWYLPPTAGDPLSGKDLCVKCAYKYPTALPPTRIPHA